MGVLGFGALTFLQGFFGVDLTGFPCLTLHGLTFVGFATAALGAAALMQNNAAINNMAVFEVFIIPVSAQCRPDLSAWYH